MCRMFWGLILVTRTYLPLAQNILTAPVAHPTPCSVGILSPFPRLQRQRLETGQSLPSSAEIVNVWSNNSTPPYAFTVCRKKENIVW